MTRAQRLRARRLHNRRHAIAKTRELAAVMATSYLRVAGYPWAQRVGDRRPSPQQLAHMSEHYRDEYVRRFGRTP